MAYDTDVPQSALSYAIPVVEPAEVSLGLEAVASGYHYSACSVDAG